MKDLPIGEINKDFVTGYRKQFPDAPEKEIFALHVGWGEGTRNAFKAGQLAERKRWKDIVQLILPLAKGYVAENQVGSNQKYIDIATKAIKGNQDV